MNYFEHKKILVPHDFSELSESAVETAIKIAGNCQNVTVLHVVDPAPIYGYSSGSELGEPLDLDMLNIVFRRQPLGRFADQITAYWRTSGNAGIFEFVFDLSRFFCFEIQLWYR